MQVKMPVDDAVINQLHIYDMVEISGPIFTGRDAVLPKVVACIKDGSCEARGIFLQGTAVFHTAVSPAGIGPTSSNKLDIEGSIPELSAAGVKMHIGKGSLKKETVEALKDNNSIFLVTPPNTALLTATMQKTRVVAFPEEGMEALYEVEVKNFPAIVAIAHGESIYDKQK
ncbi:MAG: fumarate hydratase C-terminal domain-containing protein [Cloacibacillus sp.]